MGAAPRARARPGDRLALLDVQAATRFALDPAGRILHEHAPDLGPAPRLWLAGSAEGNAVRLRTDVGGETARAVGKLVAAEPPLLEPDGVPSCLDELAALLGREPSRGVTYVVPEAVRFAHPAQLVHSDTPAGDRLLAGRPPAAFAELGFRDEDELWPPWCVALEHGEPVAVAFSARLSPVGAEAGAFTIPDARGRGFAAAATAGWAASPSLGGRIRFYSTSLANVSSQRVAERLSLAFVGPALEIR